MTIEIINYRETKSNSPLIGFVDVYISTFGLEIIGCTIFEKDGRKWVSMPQKEYVNKEGEKKYSPVNRFRDRAKQDAFSRAVIEAVALMQPKQPIKQEQNMFNEEEPF